MHFVRPLLLTSLSLLLTLPGGASAETADETATQLKAVTRELNELDNWFANATRQRNRWLNELRERDQRISELSNRARDISESMAKSRTRLAELEQSAAELAQQRDRQAEVIGEHLAAAYRMGGQDMLRMVLSGEDVAKAQRMVRYHRFFSDARLDALRDYQRTAQTYDARQQDVANAIASLEQEESELDARRDALGTERGDRETLLAKLDADIEDHTRERQRLEADLARLEALLDELARQKPELDGQSFVKRKGAMPWPTTGTVQNRFGQPRADGRLKWHGLRIAAASGTDVAAVHPGRVVFADWLRGYGLLTIVDHGGGYMTLYGHADALRKSPGDWVESGEAIATAGRSGGQPTNGVYFEIRKDGTVQNPATWLHTR